MKMIGTEYGFWTKRGRSEEIGGKIIEESFKGFLGRCLYGLVVAQLDVVSH